MEHNPEMHPDEDGRNHAMNDDLKEEVKETNGRHRSDSREAYRDRSHSSGHGSPKRRRSRSGRSSVSRRSGEQRRSPERKNTAQLYIGGISRSVEADDLREPFSKFGTVKDITMKGKYAFIEFESADSIPEAIKEMHGHRWKSYDLTVEQSTGSKR